MKVSRIKTIKGIDVCIRCGIEISYSDKFDAHYCSKCNIWLEERCVDPLCTECSKRPLRPTIKSKTKPKKKKDEIVEWDTK